MDSQLPSGLFFDLVRSEEVDAAYALEMKGFHPDEAATLEKLRYRQANAPLLFLGAFLPTEPRTLVGFVTSTQSPSPKLTHGSMSEHIPHSQSVCLHLVCVDVAQQRRGIGLALLKAYLEKLAGLADQEGYKQCLLLTREVHRPLYEKAGFEWMGKSDVVHGEGAWYEMRAPLTFTSPPPDQLAKIMEQLASRPVPTSSTGSQLVIPAAPDSNLVSEKEVDSELCRNKFPIICPRPGCGSLILLKGVAQLTENPSVELEPTATASASPFRPLPPPGTKYSWWRVTPNVMAFENIGFSKAVDTGGPRRKFLSCAECDLGPLGWCLEGGTEFWLAYDRVQYRM